MNVSAGILIVSCLFAFFDARWAQINRFFVAIIFLGTIANWGM